MEEDLQNGDQTATDHVVVLKSKKRGHTRTAVRDTLFNNPAMTKVGFEENLVRKEPPKSIIVEDHVWRQEASSVPNSSSISVSTNQFFIESTSTESSASVSKTESIEHADPITPQMFPVQISQMNDGIVLDEPVKGTAAFLRKLKDQGLLAKPEEVSASSTSTFDLTYRDKDGNVLTPKEAYKELSRKFHGTGIGKRRIEKKLKQKRGGIGKPKS